MLKTELDNYNFLSLFQELERMICKYQTTCNSYVDARPHMELASDGSGDIIWQYEDGDWFESWDFEFSGILPTLRTAIDDVKEMINEASN